MHTTILLAILRIPWILIDASSGKPEPCYVPAGEYSLERIANPLAPTGRDWIVLKNTAVGGNEEFWKTMDQPAYGEFQLKKVSEEKASAIMSTA